MEITRQAPRKRKIICMQVENEKEEIVAGF